MTILSEISYQNQITALGIDKTPPYDLDFGAAKETSGDLDSIAKIASTLKNDPIDELYTRFYLQTLARELLPKERVAQCLRMIVPGINQVDVMLHPTKQKATYRNLITCARLWFCPVCASRITEERAKELTLATARWHDSGGFVAMLTLTLRHNSYQPLGEVLKTLREAHRRFKSGRTFKTMQADYGWSGSVTTLEVTHGGSGWHPHLHELVFLILAKCLVRWANQNARQYNPPLLIDEFFRYYR